MGKFSRRKFIKGVGTGIAGSYAVLPNLKTFSKNLPQEIQKSIEGKVPLSLSVNGNPVEVYVEPQTTLVELLRDHLNLTGTKTVCNHGECGGCTVLLDDKPVYSCHLLALDTEGKKVTTIEGLLSGGKLHPIQEAFVEHDGLQCGYCTPGQVMAAQGLLMEKPSPTKDEVLYGMSGNICRCAAYPKIMESVLGAAEKSKS